MGDFVFKLPDIGEGIAEVEIVKWHVKAGDAVSEGQAFADVMTDKATVEIAAPVTGIVRATKGSEGSKLAVGAQLAIIETAEAGAAAAGAAASLASPGTRPSPPPSGAGSPKILAAPAVRTRARALGIDLAAVSGSGPEGRITHADLDRLLVRKAPAAVAAVPLPPPESGSEDIRIFGLRRRIAERMLESKRRIPHFTYVEEIDVTALEELRASLNAAGSEAMHITVLSFAIRAIVLAAAKYPGVNSHFHEAEGTVRRFKPVHVGIATQTERGLLVPVIRHAERLDLHQLAAEIVRLGDAARAGKSAREELAGSTLTVTSLGALGGVMATPIINPPEVAIVGVNRIAERAVVVNGAIVVRKMMNLSSSFDHRIVDGHEAAAFIAEVRRRLESPLPLAGAVSPAVS